jgi:hypothetical protein
VSLCPSIYTKPNAWKTVAVISLNRFWSLQVAMNMFAPTSTARRMLGSRSQNGTYCKILVRAKRLTNPCFSQIPYVAMASGKWKIVIQAPNFEFAVERTFTVIPSTPETVVVTVSIPKPSHTGSHC